MREVKIANWTPTANKGRKKKTSHKKNSTTVKRTANKTTTLTRRPGVTPTVANKFIQQGVRMGRAQANSSVKKPTTHKKNRTTAKRNGSKQGFLSRMFGGGTAIARNPGLRDFGSTFRVAGIGLAGGAASRLTSAVLLAIGDRVAPSWTQNKWASPVLTLLAALFLVPRVMGYIGMTSPASHELARTGGILFAASEGLNIITNGDKIAEWSTSLRASLAARIGASPPHTVAAPPANTGAAVASAAQQAAIDNGATPSQAAAAASGALQGLNSLDNNPSAAYSQMRYPRRVAAFGA